MSIETIIREVAETLGLVPALADVLVVENAHGRIDEETKMRIGQRSAYVTVGWNGFTPQIQGATAPDGELIGNVSIVVNVVEKASVNRKTLGTLTCLEIAAVIAKELHGASAEGMDTPLVLKRISPISELGAVDGGGAVTCDVEFETKSGL